MTSPAVGVQPSHAIFAVIFLDPSYKNLLCTENTYSPEHDKSLFHPMLGACPSFLIAIAKIPTQCSKQERQCSFKRSKCTVSQIL